MGGSRNNRPIGRSSQETEVEKEGGQGEGGVGVERYARPSDIVMIVVKPVDRIIERVRELARGRAGSKQSAKCLILARRFVERGVQ